MVNRIVKKEKDTRRSDFERRGHMVLSINGIRITETSSLVKAEDIERINPILWVGRMA
jgi:hypothetical protein